MSEFGIEHFCPLRMFPSAHLELTASQKQPLVSSLSLCLYDLLFKNYVNI